MKVNKSKIILWSYIILVMLNVNDVKSKDAYSYIRIGGDSRVVIVPESNEIIEIPNSTFAKFCKKTSKFYCFEHEYYWFSAPKYSDIKEGSKWKHNGRYCHVFSSAKTIILLSKGEPLFNIHCYDKEKDEKDMERKLLGVFLYSKKRGLLMMEYTLINSNGKTVAFITTDLRGFGSLNKSNHGQSDLKK